MTNIPDQDTEFGPSGRRRRTTRFGLAGVAGLGAALMSAAWSDHVFFGGSGELQNWSNAVGIVATGKVVVKVMEPSIAMPVLLTLLALLGLSRLEPPPRKAARRANDRVGQRDPRVDELDAELSAVGIEVSRLQEMDGLDLQLYALGVDVPAAPGVSTPLFTVAGAIDDDVVDDPAHISRNAFGVEDGLWDFVMPPSDGVGLVRTYGGDLPRTLLDSFDQLLPVALAAIDQRTPAREG